MKTITTEFPEKLYADAVKLAKDGWFSSENELLLEAVRRFIESHRPEIMEEHIMKDVEWGLNGN